MKENQWTIWKTCKNKDCGRYEIHFQYTVRDTIKKVKVTKVTCWACKNTSTMEESYNGTT